MINCMQRQLYCVVDKTNSIGENLLKDLSNQSTNVFNFKAFQKEDFSESLCRSAIGAITGAQPVRLELSLVVFLLLNQKQMLHLERWYGRLIQLCYRLVWQVLKFYELPLLQQTAGIVSFVRNSRGNILHRGSRLDLQIGTDDDKIQTIFYLK